MTGPYTSWHQRHASLEPWVRSIIGQVPDETWQWRPERTANTRTPIGLHQCSTQRPNDSEPATPANGVKSKWLRRLVAGISRFRKILYKPVLRRCGRSMIETVHTGVIAIAKQDLGVVDETPNTKNTPLEKILKHATADGLTSDFPIKLYYIRKIFVLKKSSWLHLVTKKN